MRTVTTVTSDGALEPDTVRPARCHPSRTLSCPNRLGKAREEASRGAKIFCRPSPYPNVFHGSPPFLMRLDGKFPPPISC